MLAKLTINVKKSNKNTNYSWYLLGQDKPKSLWELESCLCRLMEALKVSRMQCLHIHVWRKQEATIFN